VIPLISKNVTDKGGRIRDTVFTVRIEVTDLSAFTIFDLNVSVADRSAIL
jgi:hypothetical protein